MASMAGVVFTGCIYPKPVSVLKAGSTSVQRKTAVLTVCTATQCVCRDVNTAANVLLAL